MRIAYVLSRGIEHASSHWECDKSDEDEESDCPVEARDRLPLTLGVSLGKALEPFGSVLKPVRSAKEGCAVVVVTHVAHEALHAWTKGKGGLREMNAAQKVATRRFWTD